MEALKVDRSKLVTVTNYAKVNGLTRQTIYARAKAKTIKLIELDGVKFVNLD